MNIRHWGHLLARHRSLALFIVALVFGALAVYGTSGYISERLEVEKARLQPQRQMAEVVVAKRDLERGERIGPENMAVRSVPIEYLPGSAIRPERFEQHAGARLALPMRSGEPLLATALIGADTGAFSTRIRQGIRAMSISVDEVNSVSGMLQPGDRIDLLFSVRPPLLAGVSAPSEVTTTLMQDLAVLATGRQVRPGSDEAGPGRHFTTITVEVTPEQAQKLIVAQRAGKLTAMLRHPDDRQAVGQRLHDLKSLLGMAPDETPVAAPRAGPLGPELIVGGRGPLQAALGVGDVAAAVAGAASARSAASAPGALPARGGGTVKPSTAAAPSAAPSAMAPPASPAAAAPDSAAAGGAWSLLRPGAAGQVGQQADPSLDPQAPVRR